MRTLQLSLILLLSFLSGNLRAQDEERFTDNLKVMVNYHTGFGLPEYSALTYVFNEYVRGVDVAVIKSRTGKDEFEQQYNYPENGVSFLYTSLGNRNVLGSAFAVDYLFRLNIVRAGRFRLFNRMGIGLGYLTRIYNPIDNPLNVVIGSHVNIHYNCRFGASLLVWDRLELNAGASFDHFSNGNTAEPNIGLNYLTFYGGAICRVGKLVPYNTDPVSKHTRSVYWELFANIGAKHTRTFASHYYPAVSMGGEFGYALFRGFHLGAGVDFFYDSSIKDQLESLDRPYHSSDSFQSGIHISQSAVYRKFRFTLQEGFYLGFREPINHHIMYSRAILKYSVNEHWAVRLAMKSHLHILDYPEIGFSYKF